MEGTLDRFVNEAFVPHERVLRSVLAFPAVYWCARHTSGSQWPFFHEIVRAFHGDSSTVVVAPADLEAYRQLRHRSNDGYSNHDRANLLMDYNRVDRPAQLPERRLVRKALF